MAEIAVEVERRIETEKAQTFIPNGKVEQFIKLVGEDKTFISLFIGGNGTGKTSAGANIVANICYGAQSKFFDYGIFKNWPYLKQGRIISDPTTLKEKIIPELKKWFPANESDRLPVANYATAKEGKNFEAKFTTNTGHTFDLMSNEQDPKEFESVDLGWIWFDEPPPEAIWKACIGRARLGMRIFITFTPLVHSAWLKDQIVDRARDVNADYIEAEMEDNCKIHGERGFLEHANILQMVNAMTEDEKQARAFGKFGHLIGRIHKKFSRKIHVIRPFPINERDYTVWMALDTHPRVPDHVMWLAIDRKGTKYVCAELISEGGTKDLSERIKTTERIGHYRMQGRLIDPSAYNDDQHHDVPSVGSKLEELGLWCIKGSKDLQAGIKRLDDALDFQIVANEMVRPPEIYFFDTCPVTHKQLEEYVWQEWTGRSADGKKANPHPRDKNDHMPENLHRLLLHELQFIPYISDANWQREVQDDPVDPYDNPIM